MTTDYTKLFEDGMQRGKNTAADRKANPAPIAAEPVAEEAAPIVEKSKIQTLFELACEHASDKVFNIAQWDATKKQEEGFILEASDDHFDAAGKVYWPSIEVTVAPNSKGETFKVTLETEAKDPQIADKVSMDEAVGMVAHYIGHYTP